MILIFFNIFLISFTRLKWEGTFEHTLLMFVVFFLKEAIFIHVELSSVYVHVKKAGKFDNITALDNYFHVNC